MNNNCEFAGQRHCMCDVCKSMRETLEYIESEKFQEELSMAKEETERIFREAENSIKECDKSE